jgi:hypothetical protein
MGELKKIAWLLRSAAREYMITKDVRIEVGDVTELDVILKKLGKYREDDEAFEQRARGIIKWNATLEISEHQIEQVEFKFPPQDFIIPIEYNSGEEEILKVHVAKFRLSEKLKRMPIGHGFYPTDVNISVENDEVIGEVFFEEN